MTVIEQVMESRKTAKFGNHQVIFVRNNMERHFIYLQTVICVADDTTLQFMLGNGGYCTNSTKRALLAYRRALSKQGYTEKLEAEIVKQKRNGTVEAVDQIGATWILDPEHFPSHNLAIGFKFVALAQEGSIKAITMILEEAVI